MPNIWNSIFIIKYYQINFPIIFIAIKISIKIKSVYIKVLTSVQKFLYRN